MDFIKSSIDNLAKKQDKHNNVIERTFILERDMKTVYNNITEIKANVKDVETKVDKTSQELRDKWDLVNENINAYANHNIEYTFIVCFLITFFSFRRAMKINNINLIKIFQ